ncbi:MAG TPA: NUDIX domain-containing protein [Nocardioidaceae bacterium]|nr:NUDIX domain-containing protein [Nocardioidaceae bacterium]
MDSAEGRVVAGVAIVRHGRVLAARRTSPVEYAGGWEFPGGKVDPGETDEMAAVREIREELDCDVDIARQVPGEQPLSRGFVLRVYEATLRSGEPTPHEHDAIRWLGPEELDDVDWLAAELPFVAGLRDRLLDGTPLTGGNVGGAVRIGSTVRRPTGPWTPAVHALLAHLDKVGLDGVPRILGVDARGREISVFLPGRSADTTSEVVPDAVLVDGVRWLRRFHEAVASFRPDPSLPWRNESGRALAPGEIVCHHDPGAYNWRIEGDRVAGVVDWDMAGPGRPLDDLAFVAWNTLPLAKVVPPPVVAARLRQMADAYGDVDPIEILDAVDRRMTNAGDRIEAGQRAGDPGMLNLANVGEPARLRQTLARLRERLPSIRHHL